MNTFDTTQIPKQQAFMESLDRELLLSGAFGAGKTRPGLEKGLFLSLLYPGNRGLVARKTFQSLRSTTLDTFLRVVCPPEIIQHKDINSAHTVTLNNGSIIYFFGIDEPEKIGGLEIGWAFLDEAVEFDEKDYMMVLGRLRLNTVPVRQLFVATNPGSDTHWLYKRFFEESVGPVFKVSTADNPFNPPDYLETLEKFTGQYYERYVLGNWVGFEGLVYDNWDRRKHVVEPFTIPSHWKRYRVIDFGYTNPFVCQWWAMCPPEEDGVVIDGLPRGGAYMYREHYMSQRTVSEHAIIIRQFDENIAATITDWDAEDRATLDREGIGSIKAYKDIAMGIQVTHEEIEAGRIHIFKGARLQRDEYLYQQNFPTSTEEEFGNYKWAEIPKNKNQKEVPQDKDNHGMDCLRYFATAMRSWMINQRLVSESRTSPHAERTWRSGIVGSWR